jgi:uncharacterized protein
LQGGSIDARTDLGKAPQVAYTLFAVQIVFIILFSFIGMDLFVWLRVDRLLRRARVRRIWRVILAFTMMAAVAFAFLSLARKASVGRTHSLIPSWLPASIYIWHFLVLPVTVIGIVFSSALGRIVERIRVGRASATARAEGAKPIEPGALWSRRNFLTASALLAPPLAAGALTGVAVDQIGSFRIRRFDLPMAGWPAELDSFTIAVVADVHTGVFSTPKMLSDIADATNNLRADLVLLAGDLINISHADLPSALDMAMSLQGRYGVYMVQGNHDVMQGRERFTNTCRLRGMNLLVDELVTLKPRGVPFQLLGTRWPNTGDIERSVSDAARLRDPSLFSILLAHHPHSWDQAALEGIPLTISGHAHGGQIMLTDTIGAGPLRFKYWTGLYEKPGSKLIVSNGVGNWFPLRINAPAELLHITLHPAMVSGV